MPAIRRTQAPRKLLPNIGLSGIDRAYQDHITVRRGKLRIRRVYTNASSNEYKHEDSGLRPMRNYLRNGFSIGEHTRTHQEVIRRMQSYAPAPPQA